MDEFGSIYFNNRITCVVLGNKLKVKHLDINARELIFDINTKLAFLNIRRRLFL